MVVLLPSVLPCENAFRVSRSRTTTRSQAQRISSATATHNIAQAIGLGLSFASSDATPTTTKLNTSCQALHQIMALDQTPKYLKIAAARSCPIPQTPSRSLCTPSPETPAQQILPQRTHTPWTTPAAVKTDESAQETPRQNNYTYHIVTRNNKRKRNGDAVVPEAANTRLVTPDPSGTPLEPPGAPRMEIDSIEEDEELLDDPFLTPKRSRVRGPNSKRICATRRELGPWSEEEDKQLVGMVLAKMKLTERDWAECANTLGRDGMSVGERWINLVRGGEVGLLCEKRKDERQKRARLSGSGSGRLEPVRRGRGRQGLRGGAGRAARR